MIIPWLLSGGWRYAIMAALLLVIGVQHIELASMKAAEAKAAQIATEAARKKDAENATLAAKVDQANLEKRDALDKAADAARALARTRGLYVRARCDLPGTPSTPGSGETGTSQVRLSDETSDALIGFARDADRAALYAQACHDWAMKIGK